MTQNNGLSDFDRELLANLSNIEQALNGQGDGGDEADPVVGFAAHLASVTPQADESFRQQLEERLLNSLQQATSPTAEARIPPKPGRLVLFRQRLSQMVTLKGDMTMKKAVLLVATLVLAISVSTLALVPSVRAEVARVIFILNVDNDDFLQPTYIPDGFQSGFLSFSADQEEDETNLDQMELRYYKDEQFVTINQSRFEGDPVLPEGRPVTVKNREAVLVDGLSGQVQVGGTFVVDEEAEGEPGHKMTWVGVDENEQSNQETVQVEVESVPVKSTPIVIDYTDGRRLTFYTQERKIEILTNLPEAELFKIAEGLTPSEDK